jgi:hypothetical protein
MPIRSGIGIGEAQVFDTSGLANQYARQVASQQKAQATQAEIQRKASEKYNEELADLIANVKTEGARDNDVPDITKAYNDIKDFYSKSAQLKDTDKPLFRAELRNRINSLNEFAQRSNKLSKDVASMSGEIAKNEWDYDPNSVSELRRINQTPLKQLGADAVIDPMKYKRLPNFKMIDDILDSTYDLGKENATYTGDITSKGKTISVSKISPEFINNSLVQSIQNSPEAGYALKSLYTKTTGDTEPTGEKLMSFLNKQYETRHKYDYEGSPKEIPTGPVTPQSEIAQAKLLKDRVNNIKSLVEGKDQTVFESLKSSLPPSSTLKWLKVGDKTIGMYIKVPKTYDEYGDPISEINQKIDFTKGDPYKTINVIMGRYFGKKITNESLQGAGVGGNLRVNRAPAPSSRPATTSTTPATTYTEGQIQYLMKQNPKFTRKQIIESLNTK